MILVTLGTQDKSFERLLKALDKVIKKGDIKDKVIVQAGYTKYKSKNMEIFDYISANELEKLTKECDILITHGGVGSIMTALKHKKKVIAAARLKEYKEHTNNHQLQIIKQLSEDKNILALDNFNKIGEVVKSAKTFKPVVYKSNTKNIIKYLEDYISCI